MLSGKYYYSINIIHCGANFIINPYSSSIYLTNIYCLPGAVIRAAHAFRTRRTLFLASWASASRGTEHKLGGQENPAQVFVR